MAIFRQALGARIAELSADQGPRANREPGSVRALILPFLVGVVVGALGAAVAGSVL